MYPASRKASTGGRRWPQETSESSSDEEQVRRIAVLSKDKCTWTPVASKNKPTESPASSKDKHAATPCRKGKKHSDMRKKPSQSRKVASKSCLHLTPSRVVGRIDPLRDITRPQAVKETLGGESRTLQLLEKTNGLLSKHVSRVQKNKRAYL